MKFETSFILAILLAFAALRDARGSKFLDRPNGLGECGDITGGRLWGAFEISLGV